MESKVVVPAQGKKITLQNGKLNVPENPIIPYIEGDGIGVDVTPAMLKVVDAKWMEHLDAMDMLRQGIGLRAYGQKDPLIEYKIEAFDMFGQMIENIQEDIVRYIYRVNIVSQPQVEDHLVNASTNDPSGSGEDSKKKPVVNKTEIGRNDLCPCGSGKKYKNCCGKDK